MGYSSLGAIRSEVFLLLNFKEEPQLVGLLKSSKDSYSSSCSGETVSWGICKTIYQNIIDPTTPTELWVTIIAYMSFP